MKPQAAPLVTGYAIACALLYLLSTLAGLQLDAIVRAGFIPARSGADLILPPGTMVPFLLTPLTAAFLHGGVLHLIFNLVVLLYIGRQLEAPLGSRAMAVLLGTGAYAGALAHWLADPQSNVPMIDASGEISALIAVFALIFSRSKAPAIGPILRHWVRALRLAAAWIGVQLLDRKRTRMNSSH